MNRPSDPDENPIPEMPTESGVDLSRIALSNYDLRAVHAKGGLGEVWRARDRQLNRDVAVKAIRREIAGSIPARHRFLAEARIAGGLQHPNIIPIYQMGSDETAPFYAMRFVDGRTMSDAIREFHHSSGSRADRRLKARRLLTAVVEVAEAIAYAHSSGVLHRDLKPANVMIGEYGETVLIDWGLAKKLRETAGAEAAAGAETAATAEPGYDSILVDQTRAGSIVGSPAYIAPEQARGDLEQVNEKTDLFGLGAILFEVLTGQPPHSPLAGESVAMMLHRAAAEPIVQPRTINPRIPAGLNAICAKATAFRQRDRYPSVRRFIDDLNRWLAGETIVALPEGVGAKAGRWAALHPLLFMGLLSGVAVLFVVLIAQAAYTQQLRRIATERGAEHLRLKLHDAIGQSHADLVVVLQLLEYLRDLWTSVLRDRPDVDFTRPPADQLAFFKTTLLPLAYRDAIYVDAAIFQPNGEMKAQLALDEEKSPFIRAQKTGKVPDYMRSLLRLAKEKPTNVHFGAVQVDAENRRLLVPVAMAVTTAGKLQFFMAVHVDLAGCILASMVTAVHSEPIRLHLFNSEGRLLLEVDEADVVAIGTGKDFREQFPILARRKESELSAETPIFEVVGGELLAAKLLGLGEVQFDRRLIVVMAISERAILAEGESVGRSYWITGLIAMGFAALTLIVVALVLTRLRDSGRQFDGIHLR